MKTEKLWYTPAEVARLFGISERAVIRWCKAGHLGARKVGRKLWRIPKASVASLEGKSASLEGKAVSDSLKAAPEAAKRST